MRCEECKEYHPHSDCWESLDEKLQQEILECPCRCFTTRKREVKANDN